MAPRALAPGRFKNIWGKVQVLDDNRFLRSVILLRFSQRTCQGVQLYQAVRTVRAKMPEDRKRREIPTPQGRGGQKRQ
jgi:hypothetical protein